MAELRKNLTRKSITETPMRDSAPSGHLPQAAGEEPAVVIFQAGFGGG